MASMLSPQVAEQHQKKSKISASSTTGRLLDNKKFQFFFSRIENAAN